MSRKQLLLLTGCLLLCMIVLVSLYALSPIGEEIPRASFSRNFRSEATLTKKEVLDLKFNSFYFAGTGKNTIYLGNWTAPLHLVNINIAPLDTQHIVLNIKGIEMPDDYRTFRLKVDSPYFFLTHGVMPGIFKGTVTNREAVSFLQVDSPHFIEAVPTSPSAFALRSYSLESRAYELASLTVNSPYFEFKPGLLKKQIDGIFCVDGTVHYNKQLKKLIYLYSYRNEYFVMDTSLALINRFHTIDTFSIAPIKVAQVESKNYSTLASPPMRTNGQSCVSGKFLFVQSNLLSKNEDKKRFEQASVIDTYDLSNGRYRYSFYLDNFEGYTASTFTVFGEHLAAIYGRYMVLYSINLIDNPQKFGQQINAR